MTIFLFILVFLWLGYLSLRMRSIANGILKITAMLAKHGDDLQSQVDLLREDFDSVGQRGEPLLQYGSFEKDSDEKNN
jgi:hypothetical protein